MSRFAASSEPAEDAGGGVGVDRRHRARPSLAHRIEHRDHFVPEHLSDDDPRGVHAERSAHELSGRDSADPFDVGKASLHGDAIGVPNRLPIEAKLECLFDRHDALVG